MWMLVIMTIVSLLLFLLLWVMFAPLVIRIDTRKDQYEAELLNLARSWSSLDDDELIIHLKVPFYHFKIAPFKRSKKKTKEQGKPALKTNSRFSPSRIWNILNSFRIRVFELVMDTDDYVLNAQLVPLVQLLRSRNLDVSISFQGNNYGRLEVDNSLWRLGMAYFGINNY